MVVILSSFLMPRAAVSQGTLFSFFFLKVISYTLWILMSSVWFQMFYPQRSYFPWAQPYTSTCLTASWAFQRWQIHKRSPSLTSPIFHLQSSHPNQPSHSTKHLTGHGRNLGVIFSFYLLYSPHQIHHQILIILPPKWMDIYLQVLLSLPYPNPSPAFHQDYCNSFIYWFLLASITPSHLSFPASPQPLLLTTQIHKTIF